MIIGSLSVYFHFPRCFQMRVVVNFSQVTINDPKTFQHLQGIAFSFKRKKLNIKSKFSSANIGNRPASGKSFWFFISLFCLVALKLIV